LPLHLGEFEQLVLLALLRLRDDAYGLAVCREIEKRARREVTLGAVYKTLLRMEEKGLVAARVGEPIAERGGRRKKFYRLLPAGERALARSLGALRGLAAGLGKELEAL
jgi:DNA-binding PadR family transcriptional regulator